jgi:homoserine dehydrogenase
MDQVVSAPSLTVLKFGSSVLRTSADFPDAVHEIYRYYRRGERVVAVVSAIGGATDALLAAGHELSIRADPYATAELLATGERTSAALLGVALDRAGIPSRIVDPREVDLTAEGGVLDAEPLAVNVERLHSLLREFPVLIIPGFFAVSGSGRTLLLGRGGSDLTAVFLAVALKASRCRLVKDVDGVYDTDPAIESAEPPQRFSSLSYADALRVAGPLIQAKTLLFLEEHRWQAEVAGLGQRNHTLVHHGGSCRSSAGSADQGRDAVDEPIPVLLLGLGTVGFGVYERLLAYSEHFRVIGALVRDRKKYKSLGVPSALLYTDDEHVRALRPALVIDALPGREPARALLSHFLALGASVVSANKTVIAEHARALTDIAARSGARLAYSATVGGSTPMIESVTAPTMERGTGSINPIVAIAAVLNGTCNFVLDRCSLGASLEEALLEARQEGFAEADATDDLSGRDAERKLRILARDAFDEELEDVPVQPFTSEVAELARSTGASGMRIRQVARLNRIGVELHASILFEHVALCCPLAGLDREWNGIEILFADGTSTHLIGRGAGRWPTSEAVMADVWDLWRGATLRDPQPLSRLEHESDKWVRVFGTDHAPTITEAG